MKIIKMRRYRKIIQLFFALMVLSVVVLKYIAEKGISLPFKVSGFHGICPFGAVATFGRYITQGKFVPETYPSNFWIFLSVVIVTLLFGKVFCGWFCPLGSVQELIYNITAPIRKKFSNMKKGGCISGSLSEMDKKTSADKFRRLSIGILSSFKYILLILIIIQTTKKINLAFAKIDPFYALFNFWTGDVLPPAIIILALVLILSVFIYRPWCRYFCPLGAVLGIVQFLSFSKIKRDSSKCINCALCTKVCPVGINVYELKTVNNTECIKCSCCISACPVEGALDQKLHYPLYKSILTPILFVSVFFIPVFYGKYMTDSYYGTPGSQIVSEKVIRTEETLSSSKTAVPILLKSSMTFKELTLLTGLSHSKLKEYLGIIKEMDEEIKLRDIEDVQGEITLKYIKEKIAAYQ